MSKMCVNCLGLRPAGECCEDQAEKLTTADLPWSSPTADIVGDMRQVWKELDD